MKTAAQTHKRSRRHNPDQVDVHVGRQIRRRREELSMSQVDLAKLVSLTYQQIQKYELARDRVSSGRLHQLAMVLQVRISYFFEEPALLGASYMDVSSPSVRESDRADIDRETLQLAAAFRQLPSASVRKSLINLARALLRG